MMKKIYEWILLSIIIICSTSINANDLTLDQANDFYKQQQYEQAKEAYLSLLNRYPNNSDLLFNIGNTYYKLNQFGYAIGYFKKTLKINPFNKEAEYNLNLAMKSINIETNEEKEVGAVLKWLTYITLNTAYYITAGLLFILLIVIRQLQKKIRKKEFFINVSIVAAICFLISSSILTYKLMLNSMQKAVVIEKKVPVYSGPSDSLPVLFYINDGNSCIINKHTENWADITLENGFEGWVFLENLFLI